MLEMRDVSADADFSETHIPSESCLPAKAAPAGSGLILQVLWEYKRNRGLFLFREYFAGQRLVITLSIQPLRDCIEGTNCRTVPAL